MGAPDYYEITLTQAVGSTLYGIVENITPYLLDDAVINVLLEVCRSLDKSLLLVAGCVLPSREWEACPRWIGNDYES